MKAPRQPSVDGHSSSTNPGAPRQRSGFREAAARGMAIRSRKGGSGPRIHKTQVASGQTVDQRGFADVGATRKGDLDDIVCGKIGHADAALEENPGAGKQQADGFGQVSHFSRVQKRRAGRPALTKSASGKSG